MTVRPSRYRDLEMSTLERAIALAAEAHAGVRDKGGSPYILHPLRVMLRVRGDHQRMAAVLHDVVEDTPVTLAQLHELGFPEPVVAGVNALTKREDIEKNYFEFVERAGADDVARAVKLADIEDNMDRSRIPNPTERDEIRLVQYRRARKLLHAIEREHGDRVVRAPTILPLRNTITPDEVMAECPGERPIYACDFYVNGAERGEEVSGGLRLGRILNVDTMRRSHAWSLSSRVPGSRMSIFVPAQPAAEHHGSSSTTPIATAFSPARC